MRSKGMRIAVAESCTGGLLSKMIVDVPGASRCHMGGVVAYHNDAKTALLGVRSATLEEHGAVSPETAIEMAEGAALRFRTEVGVGTTGIMGPEGGSAEKPVGLGYAAVCIRGTAHSKELRLQGSRWEKMQALAGAALQMALEEIEGLPATPGHTRVFRIGVLASGGGTDLQSILDACESGYIPGRVVVVVSNNPDAYALERAKKHGAEALFIDHRGKERVEHEREVCDALQNYGVELIVLAGYMRMLTPYFVERFRNRIINIHPALLPLFGGKGMHGLHVHQAVLDAGCKLSGCSVHFVDERIDGGPIIAQRCVEVRDGDTPETLAARVLEQEHILLPWVVRMFAEDRVRLEGRKVRIIEGERSQP
ncbi:MAG: phosphoribosylglycinamide formyltransferase [Candidatus Thermoplasmatota archaeon]